MTSSFIKRSYWIHQKHRVSGIISHARTRYWILTCYCYEPNTNGVFHLRLITLEYQKYAGLYSKYRLQQGISQIKNIYNLHTLVGDTYWPTNTLLKVGIETCVVWEGYHQQQPFKHRPNWYHIKKDKIKQVYVQEKGHRASTEVRSISRSTPRTTGETGPVKQWWWIYTTSFASITLSAV